jgi:3-(3-hydroxy-phenyl)propionate hydroxylase
MAVEASDLYDVVVVGFGPAGEVAASTLGIAGHKVAVFERQRELYPLPRMVTFDGEACRTVQATGQSIDDALSTSVVLDSCSFGDADADPLLVLDWRGEQGGFPAHNSIFQPDVEKTLRAKVATMDNVEVSFGVEAVSLTQHDDHVELTVQPKGSTDISEQTIVKAKYVIGADGTNSVVRGAAGIEMRDFGLHERWLNFDMNVIAPLPDEFNKLIMIMDPKRPHMYMPLGTERHRFEMRVHENESDEQMHEPEVAWEFLKEAHGLDESTMSICRQVVYHYYTRVAAQWRKGRVFIAGDAAHTMTPYLGQGGCSAIRDGRNIAWKLDLVLRDIAQDALLDAYETEREPHVSTLVHTSHALSELVNIVDVDAAEQRNYAMRNKLAPPPPPFPRLEHGVVHVEADGTVAERNGVLAPQGIIRKGEQQGRGDDLLGHGFQLVSRTAPALDDAQQRTLAQIGCSVAVIDDPSSDDAIVDVDGVYGAFLDANGVDAYIMRPDWYVFGAVSGDNVGALVSELGALLHLNADNALTNA